MLLLLCWQTRRWSVQLLQCRENEPFCKGQIASGWTSANAPKILKYRWHCYTMLCTVALKLAYQGFCTVTVLSFGKHQLLQYLVNSENTSTFTYQGNSQESHRCLQAALIHEGRNSLEHTQEGMELVGHCSWHRSGDKQYHTAHKSCHWCKLVHLAPMWWWLYLWIPDTGKLIYKQWH